MRRADKLAAKSDVAERVLAKAEVGYLGLITTSGRPRVIPVDFAVDSGVVYFHGALTGEKYDALVTSPPVCFSVSIAYSVIPSHWLADENARGANHYYESVQIDGRGSVVTDRSQKAAALQLLMEKYQPEGGFRPISAEDPFYRKVIEETAVFRIDAERMETKVNMGQNHSERVQREVVDRLEERGTVTDRLTAALIEEMLDEPDPAR